LASIVVAAKIFYFGLIFLNFFLLNLSPDALAIRCCRVYELCLLKLVRLGVVMVVTEGKQTRVGVARLLLPTRVVTHPETSSSERYLLSVVLRD